MLQENLERTRLVNESNCTMEMNGLVASSIAEAAAPQQLDQVITDAVEWSFRAQHARGYWVAPLEANSAMEAEWLLTMYVLGITDDPKTEAFVRCIRSKQRPDGSWDIYHAAPAGDINTTVECYVALKAFGARASEPTMVAARDWILAHGGISHHCRVFTKLWLAMVGEWSWDDVPCLPPELVFLPHRAPFSIYQFSYWARAVIVPLLIISDQRPVRPLPPDCNCRELHATKSRANKMAGSTIISPPVIPTMLERLFRHFDKVLQWYGKHCPVKPGRETAIDCCVAWILKRQEPDGCWPISPAWLFSMIALKEHGYRIEHPVLQKALRCFDSEEHAAQTDHGISIFQPGTSPTWDTVLTQLALLDCEVDVHDPRFARSVEYILSKEVRTLGDWSLNVAASVTPGGWYFYHENEMYPDVDDTAVAMIVLARTLARGYPDPVGRVAAALERALGWVTAMVCRNGAWAAFDRDNTSTVVTSLPFCDFGEALDPPSVDVTAHVVEALSCLGQTMKDPLVRNAVRYLRDEQEDDGSWFGRWGVNYVYGVGAVLPALQSVGEDMQSSYVQKACSWLVAHQNEDGGWGETCASYMDHALRGIGPSTASQTGWALMGLLAVRSSTRADYDVAIRKGVEYLVRTQTTGVGSWSDGGHYTGVGFPGYAHGSRIDLRSNCSKLPQGTELSRGFMLRYHMYQHYFPLMALGRAREYFKQLKLDFSDPIKTS